MQIINAYANDLQAFAKALTKAVKDNDTDEAARLVNEHTTALEVFLERMLGVLNNDKDATLH